MIGFSKSLPKEKDLLSVASLADFIKTLSDNKNLSEILKNLAEEKTALAALAASGALARDTADKTLRDATEIRESVDAEADRLTQERKDLDDMRKELDQRESRLAEQEAQLQRRTAAYQVDKDALDAVIAEKDQQVRAEVAKAQEKGAAADRAREVFEAKMKAVNNIAAR